MARYKSRVLYRDKLGKPPSRELYSYRCEPEFALTGTVAELVTQSSLFVILSRSSRVRFAHQQIRCTSAPYDLYRSLTPATSLCLISADSPRYTSRCHPGKKADTMRTRTDSSSCR